MRFRWAMSRDGEGAHALSEDCNTGMSDPSVSPDGRSIAFTENRSGAVSVGVMNVDGSGVRILTRAGDDAEDPSYSPDGRQILFTSQGRLSVMNDDGTGQHPIDDGALTCEDPVFSPDGQMVLAACSTMAGGVANLVVMNVDGKDPRTLATGVTGWEDWAPRPGTTDARALRPAGARRRHRRLGHHAERRTR